MALSGDSQPHFTTLANFIAQIDDVIRPLFTEILMVCDSQGLIGKDMFAIDGCKMPSNASKEWSGTISDMKKKQKKIDRAVRRMMAKHREEDASGQVNDHTRRAAEEQNIEKLRKASRKIKKFCKTSEDRKGIKGQVVKGNITDNESAKMLTSHGVIQGYNGVASADSKYQVIVAAEAFGQGPENNLLKPLIEQGIENLGESYDKSTRITADSGFHCKDSIEYCIDEDVDAYIADGNFRKRDPRFLDRDRYQTKARKAKYYKADDFVYCAKEESCICPAGKAMWKSSTRRIDGNDYITFSGYLKDCRSCPLQKQCMQRPVNEHGRQVSKKVGQSTESELTAIDRMKTKIDSDQGRHIYSQRLGTIEPVFGNITTTKRLNRFSLRGKTKVNAQWLMYCMGHNIEKIQRYGSPV
jgi:phage shock protein A